MSWATRGFGSPALWATRGLGPTYLVLPPPPGGTVSLEDVAPAIHFLILAPDVDICLPDDSSISLAAATVGLCMAPLATLSVVSPTIQFDFEAPTVGMTVEAAQVSAVAYPSIVMEMADQATIGVQAATVGSMSSEDNP